MPSWFEVTVWAWAGLATIAVAPVVTSATAQAAPMSVLRRPRPRILGWFMLPPRDGWPMASSALRAGEVPMVGQPPSAAGVAPRGGGGVSAVGADDRPSRPRQSTII
ncbi:hypothetical protein [Micromonospora endophytica]|uniref:hypothetical protein n=2 Tax=Micromonospora endophytica TaxID=515350 RepID=UPI00201705FC|nr:hypothetical protein [Micromonospora endophytica]